jgi:pimeloyl-ACP methyl ester carboxylesterase
LLIHGLGSSKEGWWRLAPWFAEREWTVHTVDLIGHGASPRSDTYSLDAFVEGVPAGPWDLVLGHSLGGAIAIRAAGDPGFTERLILEDPLLGPLDRATCMAEFDHPLDPESQVAAYPRWHPEDARTKARALSQCGPQVVSAIVDDFVDLDLVDEVASLSTATLLLGAGNDPIVPVDLGRTLADTNPAITFEVVEGSSHSMHRDEFEAFTSAIEGWLDGR